MSQHLDIVLPIALVIMAFLLKLFMDRSATVPLIIHSTYEIPVDVIFLTLSFTTAYTISMPANIGEGMCNLFVFLIVSLINIVLWRRSIHLFEQDHKYWSAFLFVINASISGYSLYRAILLVVTEVPV